MTNHETISLRAKTLFQTAFGERLRGIVLFGSEARGEAREDSDIDLLVLLSGPVGVWDDLRTAIEAIYDLQLEEGRMIHPMPVDAEEFRTGKYPLFRTVQREGVAV